MPSSGRSARVWMRASVGFWLRIIAAAALILPSEQSARPHRLQQPPLTPHAHMPTHAARIGNVRTSNTRPNRRQLLKQAAALGCVCSVCASAQHTHALAALLEPQAELRERFDVPRDRWRDAGFAKGMATGMRDYERAVAPTKARLFDALLMPLPADAVVVEVGIGSFPNARYFASASRPLDIIGVDPNDAMEEYAMRAARQLEEAGSTLRVVHGVAEALPLPAGSADAVVCTLTLCSVLEPERAVAEVKRVLKPGGRFLFLEHVLSERDSVLAEQQKLATPLQVMAADGCHLDRRTLKTIQEAGFRNVDAESFDLQGFYVLNPTVAGIATA